jgi:hypothetical protein
LLLRIVVDESFDITGRGAAVSYRSATNPLVPGKPYAARLLGASGRTVAAYSELIRRGPASPADLHALLLIGVPKSIVPPGTELDVFPPDE